LRLPQNFLRLKAYPFRQRLCSASLLLKGAKRRNSVSFAKGAIASWRWRPQGDERLPLFLFRLQTITRRGYPAATPSFLRGLSFLPRSSYVSLLLKGGGARRATEDCQFHFPFGSLFPARGFFGFSVRSGCPTVSQRMLSLVYTQISEAILRAFLATVSAS